MSDHRPIPSGAPALSYSEHRMSDGTTAALWTRWGHGDEGQATSAPPGAIGAPEREEGHGAELLKFLRLIAPATWPDGSPRMQIYTDHARALIAELDAAREDLVAYSAELYEMVRSRRDVLARLDTERAAREKAEAKAADTLARLHEVERREIETERRLAVALERIGEGSHTAHHCRCGDIGRPR